MPSYKIRLHEIISSIGESEVDLKLLDSGEYIGEWHTLRVLNMVDSVDPSSGRRNYRLLLSVGSSEEEGAGDILRRVKPMLLVYTNRVELEVAIGGGGAGSEMHQRRSALGYPRRKSSRFQQQQQRGKRSVESPGTAAGTNGIQISPSLSDLRQLSCRRQARSITFEQFGWPGQDSLVLSPSDRHLPYAFCYGRCNQPLEQDPELRSLYGNHAVLMALARPDLVDGGVVPCCVPKEYTAIKVIFVSGNNVTHMTSQSIPSSCQCR